jgi:hypothetical protein
MQSIWLSLAWKEWQEHKWKLVSLVAIIVGISACMLLVGYTKSLSESLQISLYLSVIPLAIFVGLGITAGEQARGTLPFLQALPVPMWRVAICKLGFSLLTPTLAVLSAAAFFALSRITLPLFISGLDVSIPGRTNTPPPLWSHNWTIETLATITCVAISLVVWAAAWGMNRRDEISAGAMALVAMVVWWALLIAIWFIILRQGTGPDTARLRAIGAGAAPLGFFAIGEISPVDPPSSVFGWLTFAFSIASLSAWYVMRFGRVINHGIRSPRSVRIEPRLANFLGQPRQFPLTAIAWKQFRESGPIAAAGLFAVVAIVGCFFLSTWFVDDRPVVNQDTLNGLLFVYVRTACIWILNCTGRWNRCCIA